MGAFGITLGQFGKFLDLSVKDLSLGILFELVDYHLSLN